jgi:hypothetical protein
LTELPTTKRCTGECNQVLDIEDFRKRPDGRRQSRCTPCHKLYMNEHYVQNKAVYIAKAKRNDQVYKLEIYRWLFRYYQEHPCVDCGETDPVLLEFDHRAGSKKVKPVSVLLSERNFTAAKKEIEKCDVRCVRCHRLKTAIQNNYFWITHKEAIELEDSSIAA